MYYDDGICHIHPDELDDVLNDPEIGLDQVIYISADNGQEMAMNKAQMIKLLSMIPGKGEKDDVKSDT